jgi:predicted N-formylglutamate amidohydrolase
LTGWIHSNKDEARAAEDNDSRATRHLAFKNQKAEVANFLRKFFELEEPVAMASHAIYSRLLIDDARPLPEANKTVLDQQGKPDLPLDRVVDPIFGEEVLRERR